jgi:hypothetical protein
MSAMPGDDGTLQIEAPSREAADALAGRLERCHCVVVQRGADAWLVRAQPWSRDGRALQETLSTIEAWTVGRGESTTRVVLGDHPFTLAADSSL